MEQTRQRYDKLPTSKIYTTWARILSDHNIFCTPRGGRTPAGSNAPGALLVFFLGYLPKTSGFRSAKQILVATFVTHDHHFQVV